ncbi:MAG: ECF transporter S component, partial [Acutalibacteraceae bacterium]|nr:ECF transporter S component [Acutalibacteraceae bacterium]
MKKENLFKIVLTALFTALVYVATTLIQIPIPATGGYIN